MRFIRIVKITRELFLKKKRLLSKKLQTGPVCNYIDTAVQKDVL